MGLLWGRTIKVTDPDTGEVFDFELDFSHPTPQSTEEKPNYDWVIEIDGAKWHKKASKEAWKNALKLTTGIKQVIHVPAVMCKKMWEKDLDEGISDARASGEPVVYLDKVASGLV